MSENKCGKRCATQKGLRQRCPTQASFGLEDFTKPNSPFLNPFAHDLRSEQRRLNLSKIMKLPNAPSVPATDLEDSLPLRHPLAAQSSNPSSKQSWCRLLPRAAGGFLVLTGLALSSCAHCPVCNHGERNGEKGDYKGEKCCRGESCSECETKKGEKGAGPRSADGEKKAATNPQTRGPAPEKRRAKAESTGPKPDKHNPLWFRLR
jgi:hypothetical protein